MGKVVIVCAPSSRCVYICTERADPAEEIIIYVPPSYIIPFYKLRAGRVLYSRIDIYVYSRMDGWLIYLSFTCRERGKKCALTCKTIDGHITADDDDAPPRCAAISRFTDSSSND
jgi:hypothetical protein